LPEIALGQDAGAIQRVGRVEIALACAEVHERAQATSLNNRGVELRQHLIAAYDRTTIDGHALDLAR
jgi:hypothetical protein